MAEIKISQLPVAGALSGTEALEIVQSGTSKKVTLNSIGRLADDFTATTLDSTLATSRNSYSTSAEPAISPQASAGVGATTAISAGTNDCGTIILSTGTGNASGDLLTTVFSSAFAFPNGCVVVIQASNAAATGIMADLTTAGTTTGFTVRTGTALADSTAYHFHYIVKGF